MRTASIPARLSAAVQSRALLAGGDTSEAGMTSAEYAVGTVAACGFGGVLYKVVTNDSIMKLLANMIAKAFKLSF